MIVGNIIGGNPITPKTYILTTEDGTEVHGVLVDKETIFTATDKQVAEGYTYASDHGVSTGTREFLSYRTTQVNSIVLPGEPFSILLDDYDKWNYTYLQCIIAKFNTDINNSMYVDKVVLGDKVYATNSTDVLSSVTKNESTKSIDLNINNDTEDTYVIFTTTYKIEEL